MKTTAKSEALKGKGEWKYGRPGSAKLKHNMRAAHKYTKGCCGAADKE